MDTIAENISNDATVRSLRSQLRDLVRRKTQMENQIADINSQNTTLATEVATRNINLTAAQASWRGRLRAAIASGRSTAELVNDADINNDSNKVTTLQEEIDSITQQISTSSNRVTSLTDRLADVNAQITVLETQLADRYDAIRNA